MLADTSAVDIGLARSGSIRACAMTRGFEFAQRRRVGFLKGASIAPGIPVNFVMERDMSKSIVRNVKTLALCCLIVGGCGSHSTESATPPKTTPATAAKKVSDDSGDASSAPAGGAAWTCGNHAAGAVDYQSQSAAYLFIGDHPMCADKGKLQEFCKALATRDGYTVVQDGDAAADAAPEIAQSLPEESRDGFLQQHPKHAFEQAMAKCGLKVDQVRAQLVAEAETLLKTDSKEKQQADINFLMKESPATAEAVWNRECDGHISVVRAGEGYQTAFKGNSSYEFFCNITSTSDRADGPLKFKRKVAQ